MNLSNKFKGQVIEALNRLTNNNSKLTYRFNKLLTNQGLPMMGLTYLTRRIYNPTILIIIAPRVEK